MIAYPKTEHKKIRKRLNGVNLGLVFLCDGTQSLVSNIITVYIFSVILRICFKKIKIYAESKIMFKRWLM